MATLDDGNNFASLLWKRISTLYVFMNDALSLLLYDRVSRDVLSIPGSGPLKMI